MTVQQPPIATFLAVRANLELGQFYGINFGPGLQISDQGGVLGLDVTPVPPPPPVSPWPASDAVFAVNAAGDPTKLLKADVSGQAAATATTIFCTGTIARAFRLPDFNGTALVAQDTSGLILWGQQVQDQGSNAGFQYSTLTSNRAAVRTSQYGANAGVPGVVGFKSRGATVGALLSVAAGDVLWRATAIGVTGNDLLIPLAGSIGFEVPASGIFPTSISPDLIVALAATTTNSRRTTWSFVGLTGDLNMALAGSRLRLKEGADAMQGVAVLGAGGLVVVANTLITASSRIMFSIQDGAVPLGTIYVAARVNGTSFTLQSTNVLDTCTVAWQVWEPAP